MTPFRPRTRLALAGLALLLVAGTAGILATGRAADDRKAAAPRPALTVTTARPESARMPLQLAANGNVAAWQEAVIGSESNGLRLLDVRVNVGDVVKKGEVLAVFDAASVKADLAQAQAAVQEAEANAAAASADAKRARTLTNSGALSEQQITQYMTTERASRARVAAARATVAQQSLRLKYAEVLAPDSGIISARNATVGAVGGVGMEMFRMIRQGRLEWRAEVTAAELPRVKPGARAEIKTAAGGTIRGTVRMVAPTVDAQSRVALVYVDLPPMMKADAPLKAGMFASGTFELGHSTALTVPQQAVAVRDGFPYVFRLNADSRVSQVKVSTGRRLGDRIEVVDGLAPDAQVVVSGAGFLNDGDLVRQVPNPVPNATPATPAARPAPARAGGSVAAR
ncbi:efflux RND transporter periplasmic adaptor subunit [Herbaspirillum sp. SJZ107]|uniref:efflux RND transporter periplasmic adaptor subunit n=1 Tax=Herbaspirillum sp. SJZ107 TaxID=2572881 RepID=UPI00114D645A|nr:efflux RND transporter periplasmic adaptor subunit [Herbaspirillum sp. SJZ107]TQK07263.1 RND family efflux transporter MFP subunit [Herbaspirillum sp. SJZ107]